MRTSWFAILLSVWVFVGAPTLCLGGWMGHACDDSDTSGAAHVWHSDNGDDCHDDDAPSPYSHESDCDSDPCSLTTTARDGRMSTDWGMPAVDSPVCIVAALNPRAPSATYFPGRAGLESPGLPIPIHLSSHPLLN